MNTDKFGQMIFQEQDICDLYMTDPQRTLRTIITDCQISFSPELNLDTVPKTITYTHLTQTREQFDQEHANTWFMPLEYKNLDIAHWVLTQCQSDQELQRAGEELIMFQERNLFVLLQYLKYLVDTMRTNNIVWGVGRGSSVASFVLYLIGIHKINSLFYDLPISEFLK